MSESTLPGTAPLESEAVLKGPGMGWSERLPTNPSQRLLWTLATAILIFVAWASLFSLDQVTHATGRVAPGAGNQVIQHLEGGIVTEILVKEGDRVKRGDVLMRLSNEFSAADLSNSKTEVAAMKITLSRLEAESRGAMQFSVDPALAAQAPAIAAAELDLFSSRVNQLRQDMNVIDTQYRTSRLEQASLEARLASLRSEEKVVMEQLRMMERALAAEAISAQEVLEKRNTLQQLRTRISDVVTEIPQANGRASEAQGRRSAVQLKFVAEAEQKAAETRLNLSKAEQGLTAYSDRQQRTELRAPVNGVINMIHARTIGGVVKGGDPIIEITPVDSTVTIEARLNPKDRADVWPGQDATVKVSAFDYSVYGGLKAKVVDVSPDAVQTEKGESYFRVKLIGDASKFSSKAAITPGMTTDVDIKGSRRTILQYLLAPLEKVSQGALRE